MMVFDFSIPQRQSRVGILVMFAYTLQEYARALAPLLLISLIKIEGDARMYIILGLLIALLMAGIVAYLKYLNFTFQLDEERDEFVVTKGILNKSRTSIHLSKIQQVNINQSFLQRLVNVYELSVDTAGSNDKEASIKAISHQAALALKERIIANKVETFGAEVAEDGETLPVEETDKPFIKISLGTLFKVGITSNYGRSISLLFVFFVTIYDNIRNFFPETTIEDEIYRGMEKSGLDRSFDAMGIIQASLMFIFFLMFVVVSINLIRVIISYFGYSISKQQGSLLLAYGLLNRKTTILKPGRVQIVSLTQNYLQRKMNISELKVSQAKADAYEKEKKSSDIQIPGCTENESNRILSLMFDSLPENGVELFPNYRNLLISLLLAIVLPLSLFAAVGGWIEPAAFDYLGVAVIYTIFSLLLVYFRYRNYRLIVGDDFIIKQSGAWDVTRQIVSLSKIQALSTSQMFWQKDADLGYMTIYTAGGNISFGVSNFTVINQYVNLWLYRLETKDLNWM